MRLHSEVAGGHIFCQGMPFNPLQHLNKIENTNEEGVCDKVLSLVWGMKNLRYVWNILVEMCRRYEIGTQESGLGMTVYVG